MVSRIMPSINRIRLVKTIQNQLKQFNTTYYSPIPSNTIQYHPIPPNSKKSKQNKMSIPWFLKDIDSIWERPINCPYGFYTPLGRSTVEKKRQFLGAVSSYKMCSKVCLIHSILLGSSERPDICNCVSLMKTSWCLCFSGSGSGSG